MQNSYSRNQWAVCFSNRAIVSDAGHLEIWDSRQQARQRARDLLARASAPLRVEKVWIQMKVKAVKV